MTPVVSILLAAVIALMGVLVAVLASPKKGAANTVTIPTDRDVTIRVRGGAVPRIDIEYGSYDELPPDYALFPEEAGSPEDLPDELNSGVDREFWQKFAILASLGVEEREALVDRGVKAGFFLQAERDALVNLADRTETPTPPGVKDPWEGILSDAEPDPAPEPPVGGSAGTASPGPSRRVLTDVTNRAHRPPSEAG